MRSRSGKSTLVCPSVRECPLSGLVRTSEASCSESRAAIMILWDVDESRRHVRHSPNVRLRLHAKKFVHLNGTAEALYLQLHRWLRLDKVFQGRERTLAEEDLSCRCRVA
jgi:hypothetical protein